MRGVTRACSTVASAETEGRRSPTQHFGRDHERVWAAFPRALILAVSLRVPKENAGRRRIGCHVPEQRGRDGSLCLARPQLGSARDQMAISTGPRWPMCCALLVSSAAEPDGLERRRTLLPGTDGSNPLPPSAESGTNRRAGGRRTRSALPLVRPTTAAMSFGLLSGASVPQSAPEARRYPRRGRLQLIHRAINSSSSDSRPASSTSS